MVALVKVCNFVLHLGITEGIYWMLDKRFCTSRKEEFQGCV